MPGGAAFRHPPGPAYRRPRHLDVRRPRPADFQQWRGVEEIMRDEAHAEAEALLHAAAKTVNDLSGILPELVIPYGRVTECLTKLLKDDKDISILVLASGTGKEGPGPWSPCSPPGCRPFP